MKVNAWNNYFSFWGRLYSCQQHSYMTCHPLHKRHSCPSWPPRITHCHIQLSETQKLPQNYHNFLLWPMISKFKVKTACRLLDRKPLVSAQYTSYRGQIGTLNVTFDKGYTYFAFLRIATNMTSWAQLEHKAKYVPNIINECGIDLAHWSGNESETLVKV